MVALAQRHFELLGETQDHLAAGERTAGFDEAEVPGGDLSIEGQLQLAEAAALAPLTQELADRPVELPYCRHDQARPST
jgi:hypothetical protein